MNVVVIAPHPDDEAIACGGALRLHADAGDRTFAVFLSSGELGLKHLPKEEAWRIREAEAEAAAQHLGLAGIEFYRQPDWFVGDYVAPLGKSLARLLERERPEIVYLPHPAEWHPIIRPPSRFYARQPANFRRSLREYWGTRSGLRCKPILI